MAGTKGYSGGRNKKTAEQHALDGTFRRDRHGEIPDRGNLAVLPASSKWAGLIKDFPKTSPPPTPRDPDEREIRRLVAGLSRPQQALGRRLVAEFAGWSPVGLVLLRLALEALDRAAECRRKVSTEGLIRYDKPHPLIRHERMSGAFAAALFKQLGIGEATK